MKQKWESIDLPAPIAACFSADKRDSASISECFAENAIVKDEGSTYKGKAAIKQCKSDTTKKYQYTTEPFACEEKDGKVVVTSHLVGNFPGSPVDLRYFFKLQGDKIVSLEIIP